jgi:hypothetical protein
MQRYVKKPNNNTLVVKLHPFLIQDGNDFQDNISTGSKKYDDLIKNRIAADYTNIKSIFSYYYDVIGYKFDGIYVYVLLAPKKGKRFGINELEKISKEVVDPYDVGPDTWMEGDITILSQDEASKTKLFKGTDSSIELGVEVVTD